MHKLFHSLCNCLTLTSKWVPHCQPYSISSQFFHHKAHVTHLCFSFRFSFRFSWYFTLFTLKERNRLSETFYNISKYTGFETLNGMIFILLLFKYVNRMVFFPAFKISVFHRSLKRGFIEIWRILNVRT